MAKTIYCTECGEQLSDTAKFCGSCGAKNQVIAKTLVNSNTRKSESENNPNLCAHSIMERKDHRFYKDGMLFCGVCKLEIDVESDIKREEDVVADRRKNRDLFAIMFFGALLLIAVIAVTSSGDQSSNIAGTSSGDQSSNIFDKPAQSYMIPSGINGTIAIWGISLDNENGPRTLGEVSDDILNYLKASADRSGGPVTKDDLLISLQPGNSLNSVVNRLFISADVIDAVTKRWMSNLPD